MYEGDPEAGRVVFEEGGCQNCHGGPLWTLSERYYTPQLDADARTLTLASQGVASIDVYVNVNTLESLTPELWPGWREVDVTFTIDRSDFGFYDNAGKYVVEPGRIDLFAGNSSKATLTKKFYVSG